MKLKESARDVLASRKASSWERIGFLRLQGGAEWRTWSFGIRLMLVSFSRLVQVWKLWVIWLHRYYVKHHDIYTLTIPNNNISWMVKKIIRCKDVVEQGEGWATFIHNISTLTRKYITGCLPLSLKSNGGRFCAIIQPVWVLEVFLQFGWPYKINFLLLFVRLNGTSLVLCVEITICDYARTLWHGVLSYIGNGCVPGSFDVDVQRALTHCRKKFKVHKAYLVVFTKTFYSIWKQRNFEAFQQGCLPPQVESKGLL